MLPGQGDAGDGSAFHEPAAQSRGRSPLGIPLPSAVKNWSRQSLQTPVHCHATDQPAHAREVVAVSRVLLGSLCGVAFGGLSVAMMLRMEFPNKTATMLGAFF